MNLFGAIAACALVAAQLGLLTLDLGACRAGHVLGAAMFMVEIKGMRCLYTGDYSRVPDRHMPAADLPGIPPQIIIVESTFGTSNHFASRGARAQLPEQGVRSICCTIASGPCRCCRSAAHASSLVDGTLPL